MTAVRTAIGKYWVGRSVALLWTGQVLSQAGDSVYMIALMWLMLELTGSKVLTGLAATSAYLPTLLIGLLAGHVADRYNRRTIMVIADAVRAGLVMAIPLAAQLGMLHGSGGAVVLGLVTFSIACVSTLFNPARDALVPDIVEPDRLGLANGLIQTSWQLAMFVGPLLAGLLLPFIDLLYLFHFDALTFVASMAFILALPAAAGRTRRIAASAGGRIAEGLHHVRLDARLRGLVLVTACYNLFLMGLPFVATPVFVREVLDNRPETYAWLQAVYAGGMLPGIAIAHWLGRRIRPGRLILLGIVLDGLTYTPFVLIRSVPMALVFMAVHSIVIPLILVPRTTLVQRIVPRELWGRVFSILNVSVIGCSALGAALVGIVAESLPVGWIFLVFGSISALVGLAGFLHRPLASAG